MYSRLKSCRSGISGIFSKANGYVKSAPSTSSGQAACSKGPGGVACIDDNRRGCPDGPRQSSSFSGRVCSFDLLPAQAPGRWECIEVYYSGTKAGNIEQLASLSGAASSDDINCHFVICNGLGASDGQIQTTEKWQKQWSVIPDHTWYGSSRTIRVCVVADGKKVHPTDSQIKRAEALVETLSAKNNISPTKIFYPSNWR